jgi:repressor LexA
MSTGDEMRETIMEFIAAHVETHGYPPSTREIGEWVGLTSTATVHEHLRILQRQGRLRATPGKARTLTLVPQEVAP